MLKNKQGGNRKEYKRKERVTVEIKEKDEMEKEREWTVVTERKDGKREEKIGIKEKRRGRQEGMEDIIKDRGKKEIKRGRRNDTG